MLLHTWNMDFMLRALELAEQVSGGVSPRPPVGAVVVASDGKTIVGEGATLPKPGPHAEASALANAGKRAVDGTIYCTLEPHQTDTSTPPCTQAIIDAGIRRVVCPTIDPNPVVSGQGFAHLRAAGIECDVDVSRAEQLRANELIEGFAKHVNTGLPFVTVKWAMTLDGKIATSSGDSKWITGPSARQHAHTLRYRSDAVITGIGTLMADDPRLTARDSESGERAGSRPYLRVVIDSNARMPDDAALLNEDGEVLHVIAVPATGNPRVRSLTLPNQNNDRVDLKALMQNLGNRGCVNILVEAGEKLNGALFDLGLVDKVVAYISTSKILGGDQALTPVGGIGATLMRDALQLHTSRIENFGDDMALIGYVAP